MKPLVIYHANCADGFGAAFAAWLKLGEEAEYLPMQYGKTPEQYGDELGDVLDQAIYILDFSFPKVIMNELFTNASRVVWLDHHKTAFEMWLTPEQNNQYAGWYETDDGCIQLNNSKSGALLAWEYFHPDKEVPMLIRHIDDYDRWQFKLSGTKAINKGLWSVAPWSFYQWSTLLLYEDKELNRLRTDGEAILRAHDQNVQAVVEGAMRNCHIDYGQETITEQHLGLAANCPPHLASDVGTQLALQSGTYGLVWYIASNGNCKCSLRSNGDYDVSAIAKVFGGGGHRNAAGFSVDFETLLDWIGMGIPHG